MLFPVAAHFIAALKAQATCETRWPLAKFSSSWLI
jgi:hypothetical protein